MTPDTDPVHGPPGVAPTSHPAPSITPEPDAAPVDPGSVLRSPPVEDSTGRHLRRGASWVTGAGFGVAGINYLFSLGLAYRLSVSAYSSFAAGNALLIVGGTVAGASVTWLLAFEVARSPKGSESRREAINFAILLNIAQGIIAAAVAGGIAHSFGPAKVVAVVALATLVIFLGSTTIGYLQGQGRFKAIAIYRIAEVGMKVTVGLAAVFAGLGASGALSGVLVSDGILVFVGLWILRGEIHLHLGGILSPNMWRMSIGLAGIQALVSVTMNLDSILVAALPLPRASSATYQLAVILSRGPVFLSNGVSMVAFQALSSKTGRTSDIIRRTGRIFGYLSFATTIVVATLPQSVITTLLPSDYHHIRTVLPITAACGLVFGGLNLLSTYFQGELRFRRCLTILGVGALLQVGAISLGEQLGGLRGLAWAALGGAALQLVVLGWEATRIWTFPWLRRPSAWTDGVIVLVVLTIIARRPVPWFLAAAGLLGACAWRGLRIPPTRRHAIMPRRSGPPPQPGDLTE